MRPVEVCRKLLISWKQIALGFLTLMAANGMNIADQPVI
jgi:hypothetical protein